MKVLIVSQRYYPEQFQINEIAPELVRRGHDVTVLAGVPNYPQGDIFPGYEHGKNREEMINGVHIIRVNEHPRKHSKLDLFWNYISFAYYGGKKAKTLHGDYDIVLCYQLSPVTMLRPAVIYAKRFNKPLMNYCLDIWPESAKDHMPIKVIYKMIASYSRKLYRSCDYIAVTSMPFIDYLSRVNGFETSKMCYIPQHADSTMISMDLNGEDNGVIDFMYAGNMGKGQTLEVIIKATAEIRNTPGFKVHMVGDGSRRPELQALTRELGVQDKVVFHGNQKRSDMPDYYRIADALLITLRGNNEVGNTMPGKLQMYMTAGKPIFGAINGAAQEVIREADCGACVAAGDYKGLSRLLLDYIEHSERYSQSGVNARAYFLKHFTFDIYMDTLEKTLSSMLERS